ncbi:MAG: hybrid sensor histidine kinase/response regulator [Ktedonobacteraceae bacterium]|nr:hybrid sensor histidine kinase/response regulator [Ktedonobacteraceae bacterium]
MEQHTEGAALEYRVSIAPFMPSELPEYTGKPRILLVDDDRDTLQALVRTFRLRMPEVDVDISDSAVEALSLIQLHEYDAIISDIKMPGMNGIELLSTVQKFMPEIPILLITGHGTHDIAMRALEEGAYDYTQKPIDRDFFLAAVRRALQTRQLLRLVREKQQALERYAHSLESEVEQRTRELTELNRAKDRMLSMVSHELASPLTGLKGMLQLVRRRLKNGLLDKVTQDLESMEYSIERLGMLVRDLRDTIYIQTNRFDMQRSCCDLVALCQQVLDEFTAGETPVPACGRQIEPVRVDVDRNRISQVLVNLLSNARKYSPPGSPIAVTLQRRGDEVIIAVRDYGVGIPFEQVSCIFEQFYRVPHIQVQDREPAGLGLGLYITRAIVEQHGGHMEVESPPGEGSVFSVVLPIRDDGSQDEQERGAEVKSPLIMWTIQSEV